MKDIKTNSSLKEVIVMCYLSSGSSCVAGILHRLGINMGENLKEAQQMNSKGFYEDEDFFSTTGKIWSLYSIQSKNRREWDMDCLLKIGNKYKTNFKTLINNRQKQNVHWGTKEPRLSLLAPVFRQFLINPFYIVVYRDIESHTRSRHTKVNRRFSSQRILSAIYSLKKKHFSTLLFQVLHNIKSIGITEDEMGSIISSFYAHIDSIVADQPHLYINFDQLIKDPENSIQNLIEFLSIQPSQKQINEALSFVSPELRHFS